VEGVHRLALWLIDSGTVTPRALAASEIAS
jgi:hypothetical protein